MEKVRETDKIFLPHHMQQELCDTRLPYRQGRRLTAVKAYSIAKESNHLLIFGVPSLNLRQETKILFMKFGKLLQFNISKEHAAESFTETYHAQYERIQAARIAKRTLDTKNFYGGSLHICYAPELESVNETYQKLIQRKNDVLFRLKNLQNEENKFIENDHPEDISINVNSEHVNKAQNSGKNVVNMGEINIIMTGHKMKRHKRKINNNVAIEERFKPCFINQSTDDTTVNNATVADNKKLVSSDVKRSPTDVTEVEIVDCSSVDKTTISNVNDALNYNKFGEEVVYKLPMKPANKIKFNVNKKSLVYVMFYFKTFINIWACHV